MTDPLKGSDRRAALEALRDRLADGIEAASPRDLGPLGRLYAQVLRDLADLPAPPERSPLADALAAAAEA
ncbi:hypothetical protein [Nocardioides ultimimeridianus]